MPSWTVDRELSVDLDDVFDVRLRLVAGDVVVTTGPGPSHLEVAVVSGEPVEVVHELEALTVSHPEMSGQGVWKVVDGWTGGRRPEAIVSLRVPSGTRVDVNSLSAPVVVTGLEAELKVNTVSGDVTLKDIHAGVDVNAVSGNVDILGLDGDLRSNTVTGSLSVAGGRSRRVSARAVSGSLNIDLELDDAGDYNLSTVSGGIGLLLPAEPSLVVEATSMSGRIVSEFGLDWDDRRRFGRRTRRTIGAGGARLTVHTLSGELRLLRRRAAA